MGVSVDTSELRALTIDLRAAPGMTVERASRAVRKTLFDIEHDAQILAPVDTGTLKGSIGADVDADQLGGVVGPTAEYGADVEYGTAPHVIRPDTAGALRFVLGGRVVYAREVHHPGTAPQPYMGPAFDRRYPGLVDALGDAGEDVL